MDHLFIGTLLLQKLQQTLKGREQFRQGLAAEKAGDFKAAVSLYKNAKLLLSSSTYCQIRLALVAIKTQAWYQLGYWAYELCPDDPNVQEVYRFSQELKDIQNLMKCDRFDEAVHRAKYSLK